MFALIVTVLLSYLVGSAPTALLLGKMLRGIDIRQFGSGNVGAANAFRTLGAVPGAVCLLLDAGKGVLAVSVIALALSTTSPLSLTMTKIAAGAAAISGHLFPVWIGFKGGKGVGTAAGVLFALMPLESLAAFVFFLLVVAVSNYISLGSMLSGVFIAAAVLMERFGFGLKIETELVCLTMIIALLLPFTHRSNIKRLMKGTESRFLKRE